MNENPYAAPGDIPAVEPMKPSDGSLVVAFLVVLGAASVMSAVFAGANAGAVAFPTITRLGEARSPDAGDAKGAVAWLAMTVLASSGVAPIRGRVSHIVARVGLGLCGVVVALFAWVGARFWASLPFAADGCSGAECWTSWAVGWSNASPFVLTGLVMIALALFCRSDWVRRIVPVAVLMILVVGYGALWEEHLFDILSGPAPLWFV
ncbi:hypothetical protein [Promicromonospora soli]